MTQKNLQQLICDRCGATRIAKTDGVSSIGLPEWGRVGKADLCHVCRYKSDIVRIEIDVTDNKSASAADLADTLVEVANHIRHYSNMHPRQEMYLKKIDDATVHRAHVLINKEKWS